MLRWADLKGARAASAFVILAQVVAVAIPLLVTLDRFRLPFGEKYMFPHQHGSADLWMPYLGAQALVEKVNPYGELPPHLRDPSGWPAVYPPTMLAMYEPLVRLTNSDVLRATQVFYVINLLALVALSFIVWKLAQRLAPGLSATQNSFLLLLISLSLNAETMFAIDRGQSEIISSALTWGGVLLFLNGRNGVAMVLVTLAGAIKGYAVPVGVGLLAASRGKAQLARAMGGAVAATLLVTVPVWQYLEQGFKAAFTRTEFAWVSRWFNHSFKNAVYQQRPDLAEQGRVALIYLAVAVMVAALVRLLIAVRRGTPAEVTARAVLFTGAALGLMIGIPAFSAPYAFLMVLPAMLLLALHWAELTRAVRLEGAWLLPLGLVFVWVLAASLGARWGETSLAAQGLVLFVSGLGVLSFTRAAKPA